MKTSRYLILITGFVLALGACKREEFKRTNDENYVTSSTTDRGVIVHKMSINGRDTYVNEVNGVYFFDKDIIINDEQFNILKRLANPNLSTTERSTFTTSFIDTWPDGIVPYELPGKDELSGLSEAEAALYVTNIQKAFNLISSVSPVSFVKRNGEVHYISFKYVKGEGNTSPIGRIAPSLGVAVNLAGRKILAHNNLILVEDNLPGVFAHEIMHSLGFYHEHNHVDRDKYITIDWDLLKKDTREGVLNQFNIDPGSASLGPFDANSVMTYGSFGGVVKFKDGTNIPDSRSWDPNIDKLSEGDIAGLNHLYGAVKKGNFDGNFSIYNVLDENQVLDIEGGSVKQGGAVILYKSSGGTNQKFIIEKSNRHGYFIVRSALDRNMVLTAPGLSMFGGVSGTKVSMGRYASNSDSQYWLLFNLGDKGYALAPRNLYLGGEGLVQGIGNAIQEEVLYNFLRKGDFGYLLAVDKGNTQNGTSLIVEKADVNNMNRYLFKLKK